MFEMVGRPVEGRTFAGSRRVRLGDCSPGGRLRLDATARYLQDLSDDDTRDAGLAQMTWVVRRTVIDVHQFPTYLEPVDMVTWCSAIGSRWAERRVDIGGGGAGGGAVSISSATLWVHLDSETLRPVPTSAAFEQVFAPKCRRTHRLIAPHPRPATRRPGALTLARSLQRLRCHGSHEQRHRLRARRRSPGPPS